MDNKLNIVIMAHKIRENLIPYLQEKVGHVTIVWDEKNNVWDTCKRAWQAIDRKYEYGLVIQDDALVIDGFRLKAEVVLKEDNVYSLYLSKLLENKVNLAKVKKIDFVTSTMILNEVAICMPTKYIDEMINYCDKRNAQNDQQIGKWAKEKFGKIIYPIPSLVSHRDNIESIYYKNKGLPQPTRERKAIEFNEK